MSLVCRFSFATVCDNLFFDSMSMLLHVWKYAYATEDPLPHQPQTVCFSLHLCIPTHITARQLLPPTYGNTSPYKVIKHNSPRSQQYWLITCVCGFILFHFVSYIEIEFPMVRKIFVHLQSTDHPCYPVSLNKHNGTGRAWRGKCTVVNYFTKWRL